MRVQESMWTVEARRWAKFPATLLFALSLVWLVCLVFRLEPVSPELGPKTGLGVLGVVYLLGIIPLGSAVCGLGLLFLQGWSYLPAALLPLWPLIVLSSDKSARIAHKFSQFHQTQDASVLGNGVLESLVLLSVWVVYALCLLYLWKSWQMLPQRRKLTLGRSGMLGASSVTAWITGDGRSAVNADDGEQCMLMPETTDVDDV